MNKLTEIETVYIDKFNIDIENIGVIDLIKIREDAYNWAYEKRKEYDKLVEKNKDEFILFLKGSEV